MIRRILFLVLAAALATSSHAQGGPYEYRVQKLNDIRAWVEAMEKTRVPSPNCGTEVYSLTHYSYFNAWHPDFLKSYPGTGRPLWIQTLLDLERTAQITADKCLVYQHPGASATLGAARDSLTQVPANIRKRSGERTLARYTKMMQDMQSCTDGVRRDAGACGGAM